MLCNMKEDWCDFVSQGKNSVIIECVMKFKTNTDIRHDSSEICLKNGLNKKKVGTGIRELRKEKKNCSNFLKTQTLE